MLIFYKYLRYFIHFFYILNEDRGGIMEIRKTIISLLLVSLVLIGGAPSDLYPDTSAKLKVKPDIMFHKVSISRTAVTASKAHEVELKVSVRNRSIAKNCTGPFKIRVEWRSSVKRPWAMLGEAGVAKLCYNPASAKLDIAVRKFTDTVPSGKTHYYRITLDPMRHVTESNETNNVMFKEYKAGPVISLPEGMQTEMSIEDRLPSCDGIDLIVKGVEVIRNASGNVFIKATIKNLCEGSCTGPIIIEVDESDVIGRPGGVTQQISNGIGSKAEFTMFSALGIANDSSRICRYNVIVKSEGACLEPAAKRGNNTYRLTVDPL